MAHAATGRPTPPNTSTPPGPAAGACRKAGCHSPAQGHTRPRGVAERSPPAASCQAGEPPGTRMGPTRLATLPRLAASLLLLAYALFVRYGARVRVLAPVAVDRSPSPPKSWAKTAGVPLRDRCSFGRFTWLISQALTVTYVVGEHRLYLERNCRLPESGPQETAESRGACQFQGAEQSARVRPSGRTSAKVEAAFHGFHGSSPCKCQRLSTLR